MKYIIKINITCLFLLFLMWHYKVLSCACGLHLALLAIFVTPQISLFNYVISWTLEDKSTVIIFPERIRAVICRMHEQVSTMVTCLLHTDCFCHRKNLHVEAQPPKAMVFGGRAFGTQLGLDEIKRVKSP